MSLVVIEAEGESSAISVTGGWREHLETFRKDGRRTSLSIAFRGADIPCQLRHSVGQDRPANVSTIERSPRRRSSVSATGFSRQTRFASDANRRRERLLAFWPQRNERCWLVWARWSLGWGQLRQTHQSRRELNRSAWSKASSRNRESRISSLAILFPELDAMPCSNWLEPEPMCCRRGRIDSSCASSGSTSRPSQVASRRLLRRRTSSC